MTDTDHKNIEELATQIAAWEHDLSIADVPAEGKQRVYISLVHNHLPRLAEYDILEYDLRSGDVVLSPGFEDIRGLLEQFRQTEDHSESLSV